ncbi:MAG TPA: protein-disulfide reductase DsbD [Nevskiaceae bacterium]|nr:protein-disulfide reductase DsbD [Nevskiaceae bacterium]
MLIAGRSTHHTIERFFWAVALVVAAAAVVPTCFASGAYGRFLPPDQAFQLHASSTTHAIVLDWRIAQGYYLYRDKFHITATHGVVGTPRFPPGEVENDPNFGRVEIYRHEVRVAVPYSPSPAVRHLGLTVSYQGCAAGGICYPPITKHLDIALPSATAASAVLGGIQGSGGSGRATPPPSPQGHLASLVEHADPFWFFAVFFGLGVLLAFTPCVLPMVPILAGILGKSRGGGAWRGFLLSLAYVLAMAAVYTGAGIAAGFVGTGLQAYFQAPWIIALFAAVFVALALSLFGLYEFRLPTTFINRISALSGRADGSSLYGAAAMGALAALIVSPCVAAPIAGALIAIGQTGNPVRGGIALAALSLGMGAPLIVYGTLAGRLLPRAGAWMLWVERGLGIVMVAYAVWLLGRILPASITLSLWGVTGFVAAIVLGVFQRPLWTKNGLVRRGAGVLAATAGLALMIGGATGGRSPLAPFAGLNPQSERLALAYIPVGSITALQAQLMDARAIGRPVLVDFRAAWCTSCLEMEHTTLRQPAVRHALSSLAVLRVDVTDNTTADRQLLKRFGLYGPPAYIFFSRCGELLSDQELVGYTPAQRFLADIHVVLGGAGGCRSLHQGTPASTTRLM